MIHRNFNFFFIGAIPLHYPVQVSNKILLYLVKAHSLSVRKTGNMFRLIEPSSAQFTNHIEGTLSR